MAMGDFNGDGKVDLAVAIITTYRHILLGNGDGTFLPASSSPVSVGANPTDLVSGDFDGDGKLDLAVANSTDNALTILLGNGDGTFSPVTSSPATGTTPFGLAVGDFNADGKLDLAVANFDENTVTILLGNGDGTFAPAPSPPATAARHSGGRLHGDGKLELAVTGRGTVQSRFCWQRDGRSLRSVDVAHPVDLTHTLGMAAGDFNGDGKLDLAVAIQNVQPSPPADYIRFY